MIDSAELRSGATSASPLDPTREAASARAVLPHVREGMAVLDLHCGAGWSSLLLAARRQSGAPVQACDRCPEARAAAAQHVAKANFEARVRIAETPPEGSSFDLIYLSHRGSRTLVDDLSTATCHLTTGGKLAVAVPIEDLSSTIPTLQTQGFVLTLATTGEPVLLASELEPGDADVVLIAQRILDLCDMPVSTHLNQASLLQQFGLHNPGVLLEDDLDTIDNDCELHGRKRRDAEVLCGLAASHPGPCLDLGTSHGRSAFKLATNIGASTVTTVNMLPEQAIAAGLHITHVLSRDDIGSYPRERGVTNIHQLYANTLDWDWAGVPDGLHLAFVDACHDEEAVLQDSLQAWHRLDPGGFLIWHDFSPALQKVHPWIDSSMAGVRRFLEQVKPAGEIQHLLGSWCGVLRKEQADA